MYRWSAFGAETAQPMWQFLPVKGMDRVKILVVDDDSIILELIKLYLASIDFNDVHLALSGAEALDMVAAQDVPFDCVLLDINMPQMTGIELLVTLRRLPQYADVAVIMLTALSDRRHVAQAFVAGAWDYIIKPFDPFDLETRVHAARIRMIEIDREARARKASTATAPAKDFETLFRSSAKSVTAQSAGEIAETGVIDGDRFENCLERLALNSPNAISLAVLELENLPAIARKLGAEMTDRYLVSLVDHLSETLGDGKAILAYQGHGVFLVLSFVGPESDRNIVSKAVKSATGKTDALYLANVGMEAQMQLGEVMYRDLPKGAEPVEMLVAAAQSMMPLVGDRDARPPIH